MSGVVVMVRRQLRVNRISMLVMAVLLAVNNVVQVTAFNSIFPDPLTRAATLAGFTSNGALRALYGYPYDISSPTGWLAWRSMGFMVVVMAIWGAFIMAGALRGEEEAGRCELALSQPQSRWRWFAAALVAVIMETLVIGVVSIIGLTAVCVTQGLMTFVDCLAIGLQLMLPAVLFAAVAAVTSQLVGTTRGARIAATGVVVLALLVRTAADAGSGLAWLRWTTPLGWFEELHPPAAPSIGALVAIGVTSAVLLLAALRMLAVRDIGNALLPHRNSRNPRLFLLGRPWQAALRDDLPQLTMWVIGSLFYTLLLGGLTKTLLDLVNTNAAFSGLFGRSFALNAFMAAAFSLVEVFVSLLVVTMVVGARSEEATGRLELLVAAPMSRIGWLLGRAVLAASAASGLALLSALALWGSATATGQVVSLAGLLEAGLNCLPLIILTAGVAVAVLALAPRAVPFVYAPVAVAFLWDALGTALKAPTWVLDVSPFHALATVPAQDFAWVPALVLAALGGALVIAGAIGFRARDLATG